MSLPKEPRQKMINIMYLVLTALLALNVSAEILNAFKIVDGSLNSASKIADEKNKSIFKSFEEKLKKQETAEKAAYWLPRAQKAQQIGEAAYNAIEELKKELRKESGEKLVDGKPEFKEDDLEASTRLFVSNPPEGKAKAKDLFNILQKFKADILAINDTIAKEIGNGLPIDLHIPKTEKTPSSDNEKLDWGNGYFHMTPTIASLTILSKFQNDIRNSEAQIIEACHKKIGEVEFIYDQFKAMATASTQYAMPGEQITITAGIGSFSKAAQPSVSIDGASAPLNTEGAAEYKFAAGGPGEYTKKVTINYTTPAGKKESITKDVKFTVGVPSGLVISTDKTRVFYQDLENELHVTGGSGDEKIKVTVDAPASETKKAGAGMYIVTPHQLGVATVTVADDKGAPVKLTIPIKRVPNPTPKVGGKGGGEPMPANLMRVQKGLAVELKDFIFEGVKYDVVSFTMYAIGKGFEDNPGYAENVGPYFGADAQAILKKVQPNTTIVIEDIKVKGPGGTRTLDQNMTFILQ